MALRRAHIPSATLKPHEVLLAVARPLDLDAAEAAAAKTLGVESAVLFRSARGAIAAACAALAPAGRIGVPSYTCVAVPNGVASGGGTAVYVDVDNRGLVAPGDWPVCDVVLVQDTYGFSAVAPEGRTVLRDAAHRADLLAAERLSANGHGADVAVTSFEHSKWLSAGQGGLAVTDDPELAAALRHERQAQRALPPSRWRHALVTLLVVLLGRAQFAGSRNATRAVRALVRALSPARLAGQSDVELAGHGVDPELLGAPTEVTCTLIVSQLRKLRAVAAHRSSTVALYDRVAGVDRAAEPLVRYPMTVESPDAFEGAMRRAGWDVSGRWFTAPLHPERARPRAFGFHPDEMPSAQGLAGSVVNLPTHPLISERHAAELIQHAVDLGARPVQ